MRTEQTIEERTRASWREWVGLAVLALPTLLLATDVTVLYLAIPEMSAALEPTSTQTLWIIDSYGFLIAGFLLTMGALGDRIGRRRLLMVGGAIFGLAALGAAYATSPEMLIAARAAMGIAGATLMPSTLALIGTMFTDRAQRASAIGIWAASLSAGIALGPLVGGLLLERFWWGSVFLMDVPVMVLLLVAAPLLLPEFRDRAAGRLDLASAMLSLGTVLPVIYGIKRFAEYGLEVTGIAAVALGVSLGVAFARRQSRLARPMFDLSLFRNRAFSAALAIMLGGLLALGGLYLFVTQYLQLVADLSPLAAGLWLLPAAVGLTLASVVSPLLARRFRAADVVAGGLVSSLLGSLVLTQVTASGGLPMLITGFVLFYLGVSPLMALGTDLVIGAAPAEQAGSAAAMSESSMEMGVALGVATLGSLGAALYQRRVADALPDSISGTAAEAAGDSLTGAVVVAQSMLDGTRELLEPAREAFTSSLTSVAMVSAGLIAVLLVLTTGVLRRATAAAEPGPAGDR